jgi:hypothetical protein
MKTMSGWTRLLACAPLAALVTVIGCGGDGIDNSSDFAKSEPAAVVHTTEAQLASVVGESKSTTPVAVESTVREAGGSLPPDLEVSVPDTLVGRGQSVELTAIGTPDIKELILWDGLNDRQAFTHGEGDTWRVTYRVPLRPRSERIGLSVTAKNEAGRWHRRWVFLTVGEEGCCAAPSGEPGTEAAGAEPQKSSGM